MNKYLVLLFSISVNANAQLANPSNPIGQSLDSYAKISGGWFLNQKCKFLSDELSTKYTKNVETININMQKTLADPKILYSIQSAAKSTSEKEPYSSCGADSRNIVVPTVLLAENWANSIQNTKHPKHSQNIIDYGTLYVALQRGEKCNLLSAEEKSDFSLYLQVISAFLQRSHEADKDKIESINAEYAEIAKQEKYSNCNPPAKEAVINAKNYAGNWAMKIASNGK